MYIVIIGAGNIGYYLAQLLLEENHDCVVVDRDAARCQKIANDLDIVAIQGDASDPNILKKASVEEADAVVALTRADETNMIVCLLAKDLGAKQVGARISRVSYNEEVLRKLGIDIVIHPEAAAAGYIEELITKPEVLDLAFISRGDAEIMEFKVTSKSKLRGKKIKNIENPSGSAIVALFEDGQLIIPSPEAKIKTGMKVLVLAKREVANQVRKKILS